MAAGQGRRRHRPCLTSPSHYRRSLGGIDSAATIAPHAVTSVGTTSASRGTASLSALSSTLCGFAAASTPTTATTAPNTACTPFDGGTPGLLLCCILPPR